MLFTFTGTEAGQILILPQVSYEDRTRICWSWVVVYQWLCSSSCFKSYQSSTSSHLSSVLTHSYPTSPFSHPPSHLSSSPTPPSLSTQDPNNSVYLCKIQLPSVPVLLAVSGLFDVEWCVRPLHSPLSICLPVSVVISVIHPLSSCFLFYPLSTYPSQCVCVSLSITLSLSYSISLPLLSLPHSLHSKQSIPHPSPIHLLPYRRISITCRDGKLYNVRNGDIRGSAVLVGTFHPLQRWVYLTSNRALSWCFCRKLLCCNILWRIALHCIALRCHVLYCIVY